MAVRIMDEAKSDPNSVTETKQEQEGIRKTEASNANKKEINEPSQEAEPSESESNNQESSNTKNEPESTNKDESSETAAAAEAEVASTPEPAQAAPSKEVKTPWPLRDIKEPHENDVLYGRGGGTNHHPGNKRYRKIVESRKLDYISSRRLDKPLVALEIIRDWRSQDPPGRFLKQDEVTGFWNDVGDKKAREKTSQALRERAPQIKRENEKNHQLEEEEGSYRGSYSDPERDRDRDRNSSPTKRNVNFSPGTHQPSSDDTKRKLKRAVLIRDHSLGTDYVNTDYNLDGFSWEAPATAKERSMSSMNHNEGGHPHYSSGITRGHSLAMNSLTYADVNDPIPSDRIFESVDPSLLPYNRAVAQQSSDRNHTRRSWSGGRNPDTGSYRDSDRNSHLPFTSPEEEHPSSHRRSNSSNSYPSNNDYHSQIYQSWSTGQSDEYYQQNPDAYSSWARQEHESAGDNRSYERSSSFHRSGSTGSRSSSYRTEQQQHSSNYNYSGSSPNNAPPYAEEYRSSPRHSSNSNSISNKNEYYSRGSSYDHHQQPQSRSSRSPPYRSSPNRGRDDHNHHSPNNNYNNYPRERRPSPPSSTHTHRSPNRYRDSYDRYDYPGPVPFDDRAPHSRPSPPPHEQQQQHTHTHTHTQQPPAPIPFNPPYPPELNYSTNTSKRRERSGGSINSTSVDRKPFSGLDRPSTVKRATSNQNEEAETKKDTKIIKRPGLNREHSLTAYYLREEQQKKNTSDYNNVYDRDRDRDRDHHTDTANDLEPLPPSFQPDRSSLRSKLSREHSLAANKLMIDNAYLEEKIESTIFDRDVKAEAAAAAAKKSTSLEEPLSLDDDIQNLSHATREIDLGHSPTSLEKPSTLTSNNRQSTIEIIENAITSETSWLDELEP